MYDASFSAGDGAMIEGGHVSAAGNGAQELFGEELNDEDSAFDGGIVHEDVCVG